MTRPETIRQKVIVAVVAGTILGVGGYLGRAWWPVIWTYLWDKVQICWKWLFSGHEIPGIIILVFIAIFLILICRLYFDAKSFLKSISAPDWREFKSATISGIMWRWNYDYSGQIHSLTSFCPDKSCDMQIYPKTGKYYSSYEQTTMYECDRCGFKHELNGGNPSIEDNVSREIQRLLRTDRWKNTA